MTIDAKQLQDIADQIDIGYVSYEGHVVAVATLMDRAVQDGINRNSPI